MIEISKVNIESVHQLLAAFMGDHTWKFYSS